MKKTRLSIAMMSLLTLSVATLGFSTRILTSPSPIEGKVDTDFGLISDINSYIKYGNANVFDYCKDGVIYDGQIVNDAEITVPFYINLNNPADTIGNHLQNSNRFILRTKFKNGSPDISNIFTEYLKTVTVSYGKNNFSSDYKIVAFNTVFDGIDLCTSNFETDLDLNINTAYFSVKYSFSFPTLEEFNNNVYQKLNRGKFWFNFAAEIAI